MEMTEAQRRQCHLIIHAAAVAAGAGNAVPVPGLGVAADTAALTLMAVKLAAVFGTSLPRSAAEGMAMAAVKRELLKRPVRTLARELGKLVPFLGPAVAPAMAVGFVEAAGWSLAKQLAQQALPRAA